MDSASPLDPMTRPSVCETHVHIFPLNIPPLVNQCVSTFKHAPPDPGDLSENQGGAYYYIGYPQIVVD